MFKGRMARLQYLLCQIFNFILFIFLYVIGKSAGFGGLAGILQIENEIGLNNVPREMRVLMFVWILFWLLFLWINFYAVIKRLHDIDKSGKRSWLILIPIVGLCVKIYLFFPKGTEGENQFGEAPKPIMERLLG